MHEPLAEALQELQAVIAAQPFALAGPDQESRRDCRDRLVADLGAQLARLADWDAPVLAVLGGGTGSGKSTVANSLVGLAVAMTGVIRPTTSSPTLLVGPRDVDWFTGDRILPSLPRVQRHDREPAGVEPDPVLQLVSTHAIPPGLAVLDTPDIDSVRLDHRQLADQLLDAADVWLWFVTPRTYADEEGMGYLRRAQRRRTALAVVLSQVHDRDVDELVDDLHRKLSVEGLGGTPVLTVPYSLVEAHRLRARPVAAVRTWLHGLAEPGQRDRLRRQTLDGALDDLRHETEPLLAAVQDEIAVTARLAAVTDEAHGAVAAHFAEALDEGLPLRQEVLDRWRDYVGDGKLMRLVETAGGQVRTWLRDVTAAVSGAEHERVQRQVQAEVAGTVVDLITEAHTLAAAGLAEEWERLPAGSALLDASPELRRPGADLEQRARAAVVAWQEAVVELIHTRGATRKLRSRWMSTFLNACATAAILVTFASTGGLTGAETGIALGAGAANQALLAKLLGAHNLQWLQQRVREDLLQRVAALAGEERSRYVDVLAPLTPGADDVVRIVAALGAVERARR